MTARWQARLSDGSTAREFEAPYEEIAGELSPWQKLKAHVAESGQRITSLSIVVERAGVDPMTLGLPHAGPLPWNRITPIEPESFNYQRWAETTWDAQGVHDSGDWIEIRAIYKTYVVSLFVDEDNCDRAHVVVHERPVK